LFIRIILFFFLIKDNLILRDLLINQITHLNIDIKETEEYSSESGSEIFAKILSLCKNLIVLNFCDMFLAQNFILSLTYVSWNHCIPSTLIKLRINLSTLVDCLHLLDGPFVCLSTLIINVTFTLYPIEYINPTVGIHNNHIYTKNIEINNYFYVISRKNFQH
jgi:hypothetical protein